MARPKKAPTLRQRQVKGSFYFSTDVTRPDGSRTTVSFGAVPDDVDQMANIHASFGKWLKLFQADPHKCLSYTSPWEAIDQMLNPGGIVTVGELIDNYLKYAEKSFKFTRDGGINPHYHRLLLALGLMEKYRSWPVHGFGPDDLADVQQSLIDYRYSRHRDGSHEKALTRGSLNATFKQVRRMFVWGVGRRMVDPATEMSFHEIKKIKAGHPTIRDGIKRAKVTDDEFNRVVAVVNPTIGAMMQVLRYTVCRPGEVTTMRLMDIRQDVPECWLYIPGSDKGAFGEHKGVGSGDGEGKYRFIPITGTVQKILKPFMDKSASPEASLFKPSAAVQEFMEERFDNRTTDLSCGNRPGTNRKEHPMIKPGDIYKGNSFYEAIKRGCKRAGVPNFSAYDLRRASITDIDAKIGDQNATRLVGHADRRTTDIYKMEPVKRMMEAAREYEKAISAGGKSRVADEHS